MSPGAALERTSRNEPEPASFRFFTEIVLLLAGEIIVEIKRIMRKRVPFIPVTPVNIMNRFCQEI